MAYRATAAHRCVLRVTVVQTGNPKLRPYTGLDYKMIRLDKQVAPTGPAASVYGRLSTGITAELGG